MTRADLVALAHQAEAAGDENAGLVLEILKEFDVAIERAEKAEAKLAEAQADRGANWERANSLAAENRELKAKVERLKRMWPADAEIRAAKAEAKLQIAEDGLRATADHRARVEAMLDIANRKLVECGEVWDAQQAKLAEAEANLKFKQIDYAAFARMKAEVERLRPAMTFVEELNRRDGDEADGVAEILADPRFWAEEYAHAAQKLASVMEVDERATKAEAEVARLRAALKPFAAFADAWDRRPIRGIDDELYGIHGGVDRGVLRLSDCRVARAALSPEVK